jgi:very-short-patch-repair endonuclease
MSRYKKFDFKNIRKLAQELRKNMTESEIFLWKELRGRKFYGYKFLRQHPLLYEGNLKRYNYFIADFFCDEKKSIIELDGPIHDEHKEYDEFRDSELHDLGFHILRIKNEELNNMKSVLERIESFINQTSES